MLIDLLGYLLLGLVLAAPLWHGLQWLGRTSGLYTPQWKYLRPYVPTALPTDVPRSAPDPRPGAPAAAPQEKTP
jgi:hypothetical protein